MTKSIVSWPERAEESVISLCINHPQSWEKVKATLKYPECFHRKDCQQVYKLIERFHLKKRSEISLDLITLSDFADAHPEFNVNRSMLAYFANVIATYENLESYIKTVFDSYTSRKFASSIDDIREQSSGDLPIKAVLDIARQTIADISVDYDKAMPTVPLDEFIRQKREIAETREFGKLLGHGLSDFRQIRDRLDGIQPGFYIVAAETNRGKTAFLTNLCYDLLKTNQHLKAQYFSLDDNKDVIVNRFLAIKAGMQLNEVQRTPIEQKHKDAYDFLIGLAEGGRLDIRDQGEISDISSLELAIRDKAADNLTVFIDGLYNLEVGRILGGLREQNIDRANKVKALVDTYNIPVIVTGELRKRQPGESAKAPPPIDRLMETGKFAYNANLVWMLYPENPDSFDEDEEAVLLLRYAKNKLSSFKGIQKLKFLRAIGRIEETI